MYLKKLRINGFKSFADNTTLNLEPGVTAIVGPNGCGKSNIADAIRWVLGEQSPKSLRAGAMQDVIFQGTDARKAVGLCEVSLLFANCEEQLGTSFHEVEVMRQVTPEGGSDYYLNGKACRLRDIQRLFLDTGVGQVSYSFMLQGQIDKILSSNPAERRVIFEEAAGISRYKAQRREALQKLSQVDANLARVTDVIEEVSRQIVSLKRQASKAIRYKRIDRRLRHLDLAWHARQWADLAARVATLEEQTRTHRGAATERREQVGKAETEIAAHQEARDQVGTELQELQQSAYDLRSDREHAVNQVENAQTRTEDANKRLEEIEEELAGLAKRRAELQERTQSESASKQDQQSLVGSSDEIFKAREQELREAQEALTQAEAKVAQTRQAILVAESALTRARSDSTHLEVELTGFESRQEGLREEWQRLQEAHKERAAERDEIVRTAARRRQERTDGEEAVKEAQTARGEAQTAFRAAQDEIQKLDRAIAQHVARIGILENLQQKLEGFGEGAKAILSGKMAEALPKDRVTLLMRVVKLADRRYAQPLEILLGSAADALYLDPEMDATGAISQWIEANQGRACFQLPGQAAPAPTTSADLPEGLTPASEVVSASDPAYADAVGNLVQGCWFCDDLDGFLAWWREHPDFRFSVAVTPEGTLVDHRGLVFAGRVKKGRDQSFLERAAEIKSLKKEQDDLEQELDKARKAAEAAQEKLNAADATVNERQQRLLELAEEVSTLQEQERAAEKDLADNTRRRDQLEKEQGELQGKRDEAFRRKEKAQQSLKEAEATLEARKGEVAAAEQGVEQAREARDARREALAEVRLERADKQRRLEMLDRTLSELSQQARELSGLTQRREQERDYLQEQISEHAETIEKQQARADELQKTYAVVTEQLETRRARARELEAKIREREQVLRQLRSTAEESQEALGKAEVALARAQADREHLQEEAVRRYQQELAEVDWAQELWLAGEGIPERMRVDIEEDSPEEDEEEPEPPELTDEDRTRLEETDWSEVRAEIDQLSGRLQAMGPVNLVAIQEYRELRERNDFLKGQSDDLWSAKEELTKAIDEINTTSQELFSQTFAQIRKNFTYTFETLFGGGAADLELIEGEDVLEAGIEITARPPGTKLKSLALLSGGQKTMTAVALLFAIYMVKPSPFCVLDELDAPLDDANIGRFCEMLQRFLEFSQFLIITHNKRTIAAADTIYGVTMQEKGVSRLLSMRFNRETQQAEAVQQEELRLA